MTKIEKKDGWKCVHVATHFIGRRHEDWLCDEDEEDEDENAGREKDVAAHFPQR